MRPHQLWCPCEHSAPAPLVANRHATRRPTCFQRSVRDTRPERGNSRIIKVHLALTWRHGGSSNWTTSKGLSCNQVIVSIEILSAKFMLTFRHRSDLINTRSLFRQCSKNEMWASAIISCCGYHLFTTRIATSADKSSTHLDESRACTRSIETLCVGWEDGWWLATPSSGLVVLVRATRWQLSQFEEVAFLPWWL